MNYDLTNEQNSIKEKYTAFCNKEFEPRAQTLDQASSDEVNTLIKENIKKTAELGYLGMGHEEKLGGSNLDLITQAIAGEEVAKACASTYHSARTSSTLFGMPVRLFGTEEQKEKYLPGIIKGDIIGCYGLTEPEAGSDFSEISTSAVKKGDKWILNGTKTFITNASIADAALVFAYSDKDAGAESGITCFIVEKDAPGFSVGKSFDKMGLRGSPTSELILSNCEVPESAVLGEVGKGSVIANQVLEYGRLGMAIGSLGIAVKSMELSNQYSKSRIASGKPINRYQEVSFKLADMMILVDISRLLIHKAVWLMNNNDREAPVLISCAKVFSGESATQVSNMAVQIHGGYGYIKEFTVERLYRDAKLGEISEGTTEVQRMLIAKDVLDKLA